MAYYEFPLTIAGNAEGVLNIAGKVYNIKYSWNTEGQFGTISFYDSNNNPIVKGIKIVLGINILTNYTYNTDLPDTPLFIYRVDNTQDDPKQWEMGNEVKMVYIY